MLATMRYRCRICVFVFFLAHAPSFCFGQDRGSAMDNAISAERLVEGLSSPQFSERAKSTRALRAMGADAHALLERIVRDGAPEPALRALELLKESLESNDEIQSTSAQQTLKRIEQTGGIRGEAARRALEPKLNPLPAPNNRLGLGNAPLRGVPNFNQRALNLRISIRSVNGVREIEVVQNGRKFRFRDVEGGLQVERPQDRGGVKRKTYKDEAALKAADAEAWSLYQKAGGKGPKLGPAAKLKPFFIPRQPNRPRILPPGPKPRAIPRPARPIDPPESKLIEV